MKKKLFAFFLLGYGFHCYGSHESTPINVTVGHVAYTFALSHFHNGKIINEKLVLQDLQKQLLNNNEDEITEALPEVIAKMKKIQSNGIKI